MKDNTNGVYTVKCTLFAIETRQVLKGSPVTKENPMVMGTVSALSTHFKINERRLMNKQGINHGHPFHSSLIHAAFTRTL